MDVRLKSNKLTRSPKRLWPLLCRLPLNVMLPRSVSVAIARCCESAGHLSSKLSYDVHVPTFSVDDHKQVSAMYIGCFEDYPDDDRVLTLSQLEDDSMTPSVRWSPESFSKMFPCEMGAVCGTAVMFG